MNTIFKPMLAEPSLIGGLISNLFLLLLGILVFAGLIAGIISLVVLLVRLFKRPTQEQQPDMFSWVFSAGVKPPTSGAQPQPPPVASTTQVMPRKCPQCGAALQPDVPEGLCPACLLQRGIATESGGGGATATPFVPPTIPELTKLFPQLEILELIGKGGMGAVYKARQPALDRFVALKILAPRSGGDLDFAGRFTREARALARLSHPNIVGVFDFGEMPGHRPDAAPLHYFIMEFVDGPNLRQAGKLSPREAMEIIPQICAALQFAHDEGIVHRDIKPENVLLDKKGRVKIADFGLAKILGQEPKDLRLTGAQDIMGTPHYMAPEQVERPQDVDHRADIYSLGVVFYELLTGELPLGKFQSPSQKVAVDVRLDEVVLRSLAKEPERRYQHVSEMGTRVETIASSPQTESRKRKAESGEQKESLAALVATRSPMRRGILVGLAVFLFIALAATVVTVLLPETYVGIARVSLAGVTPQTYNPYFAQSESDLVRSTYVLKQVVASLDLSKRWSKKLQQGETLTDTKTAALMHDMVEVHAVPNANLLEIRFYADSPADAAEIANKIAETYRAFPQGHCGEILDRATPQSQPIRPNRPLNIFIGGLVGVVLGLLVGGIVAVVSFLKSPRATRDAAKPDRFWRWFAVVVLALISLPFVISILGILAAIAIPNFVKARQRAQEIRAEHYTPLRSDYIGKTWFPRGDYIEIISVKRTPERLTVKGRYQLVSADRARLALYVTSTNDTAVHEGPTQTAQISKGQGDFELTHPHLVPGLPHLTMYSADGKGFAEIYFGTKDEADAESKLELGTSPANAGTHNQYELRSKDGAVKMPVPPGAEMVSDSANLNVKERTITADNFTLTIRHTNAAAPVSLIQSNLPAGP